MISEDEQTPSLKLEGLSIWIDGRERPDSQDLWDANWLDARVLVEAPGASVELRHISIRVDELAAFDAELQALYRDLKGTAALACLEAPLSIRILGDRRGRLDIEVDLTPDMVAQRHWFRFSSDQSYLPELLAGLRRVLETYEMRGEP